MEEKPVPPSTVNPTLPLPPDPKLATQMNPIPKVESKNWSAIIFFILFLIASGFAGYFGYLYYQTIQQPSPVEKQVTIVPSDPTANWKTYTDDLYKFTFKYPKDWKVNCPTPQNELWQSRNICDLTAPNTSLDHGQLLNGAYLVIGVEKPNPNYSNLTERINFFVSEHDYISVNKTVNNIKGYQLTAPGNSVFVFESEGHFITAGGIPLEEDNPHYLTVGQILSTFTFTDNLISTSNICKTNLTSQEFSINLPIELNASQDEIREEYYSQFTYSGSIGSLTISCGDTGGGCDNWQTIDIGGRESQACITENDEKQTTTLGASIKSPSGSTFSFGSEISNDPGNLDLLKQSLKTFQFSN